MVDKNKKKVDKVSVLNKRVVDFIFVGVIIVLLSYFVFAVGFGAGSIVEGGNYSRILFLNCSPGINTSTGAAAGLATGSNVTFFYNASGGATGTNTSLDGLIANAGNLTGTIWNDTDDLDFNATIDTSLFADGTYNISCYADNGSVIRNHSSITNVTFDNTVPVVNFTDGVSTSSVVHNGNYSASVGNISLNVSVSDATFGIDSVYFNMTNSSGGWAPTNEAKNFTRANHSASVGNYYNVTIDITNWPDGKYNITVWANDSVSNTSGTALTNLNSTEYIQITIDDTSPSSVTIANTTSTTQTQIVATITAVDATTGINTCGVDSSSGVTVTGTGTGTQTMTNTGLNCGTVYSYIATCADQLGNTTASAQTSLSTSPCDSSSSSSSSSSGGSGKSTQTWVQTFTITDEQFEQGYNRKIGANRRAKVKVGGEDHYVGIKSLTATSATIEISSNPITVNLDIGEDAKVDVDEDGIYDVYVKLNGIVDGEADLTIRSIDEAVPAGVGEGVSTSGEIIPGGEDEDGDGDSGNLWIWIVVGIILIAVVIGGGIVVNNRR
ncbi:MAG: hypothetical protein ABIA78_00420 [archaeon]